MDRTERFYKIDILLKEKSVVPLFRFMVEMEVSRSTVKRDIACFHPRFDDVAKYYSPSDKGVTFAIKKVVLGHTAVI